LIGDDYQELAALWNAPPAAEEEAELQRLARRTPRVARMAQWGELAVVILLAATITLSIVWKLGATTLLVGSLVLLLLAWSAWKRHRLGNIALMVDGRDRITFVRTTLRAKESELDRSALGLALIVPSMFMTMLLGFSLREGEGQDDLAGFLVAIVSTPRGLVVVGFLLCALLLLVQSHLRLLGELRRLRALHEDYEAEERLDQFLGR
jgi:hypothetical protein